jgi:hypothetical protein
LTILTLLAVAILVAAASADVEEPLRIRCQWTAPTEGSPVVLYQLQVMDVNSEQVFTYVVPAQAGETQEYIFTEGDYFREYQARVRGLDADGDEGPWSEWSDVKGFEADEPEP